MDVGDWQNGVEAGKRCLMRVSPRRKRGEGEGKGRPGRGWDRD